MAELKMGGEGLPLNLQQVVAATSNSSSKPKKTGRPRISSVEELREREEPKWTVFSASQNLSAALNDPARRELDLFTKTWGGYFTPTAPLPPSNIPNIELGDFLRYLKETAAGRKLHRSIMRQLKKERETATPSSPMNILPIVDQLQQDGHMYDLSTIPRIFMQADFSLEDPPTFQDVLPLSQLLPLGRKKPAETRQDTLSSKLLHEKLTHYLDIIEVHLAHQISQRSDVFFSTLSSQQELQSHIMQVRHEVVELRHRLRQLDSTQTHGSLQLLHLCTLRSRYVQVYQKLKLVATVQQTQPTIQLLLSTSDFVGALDLIATTQEVLQSELQGVHSLRHLGSQLAELERAIEKMMEADFVKFAMEDIQQRLQYAQEMATAHSNPERTDSEERLVSVVYGLLRQSKLHFLTALREELLAYLKLQVKEILQHFLHVKEVEGEGEEAPSLADCMRGMEFDAWMGMLKHVFDLLLVHLSSVQGSLKVIASVCEAAGGRKSATKVQEDSTAEPASTDANPPQSSIGFEPDVHQHHRRAESLSDGDKMANMVSTAEDLSMVMQSFEVQEAEDRLEQLLMEDELSDARIGIGAPPLPSQPQFIATVASSTPDVNSVMVSTSFTSVDEREEVSPMAKLEQLGRRGSRAVAMATQETLTLDSQEEERLKSSLTIAGVDDSAVISPSECKQLLMECHEIMSAACDLIHARCAKILVIRAKAGLLENLVSSEFVSLVRLTEKFVSCSTQITGRHCPNLRSALLTQAKRFLEHFHETKVKKLSLLLDGERWKQADVPAEIQSLVHTLESGIPLPSAEGQRSSTPDVQSGQPPSKYLIVRSQSFAVVGILLLMLNMIMEYCQRVDDLPMLVNEVMSKLIETLKYFNSRTCDLVLGAGAVDAVGLKTITARHLALVSRCLQAILLLIPAIRRHFQLRLATKQHILLTQFDQVTQDFSNHCRKINSKVMNIMDELITKQLAKWEAKSPIPSPCFKTIVKQVVKLHENLVDILPQEQLEGMFGSIEQIFKTRLRMQLIKLGITNNGSTQHGIVNSELTHFKGALSSLENITAFGGTLFDVWTVNR